MKKKLLALLLSGLVCFSCGGCQTETENEIVPMKIGKHFTIISHSRDTGGPYLIMYENNTRVKYLVWARKGGITPLYNADGSLQLYTGE